MIGPVVHRAVLMYRTADGTDGNHVRIEGTHAALGEAIHGALGAHNPALVWVTDAATGELIIGLDHSGRALTAVPSTTHGFMTTDGRTVYPPHARITTQVSTHSYRAVRGFTATVLVYDHAGMCIGIADPRDLGYDCAGEMVMAGAAS